jgi:hypothetical protein
MKWEKLAVTTPRQNWGIRRKCAYNVQFSGDLWHFRHEFGAGQEVSREWSASPSGKYPGGNADGIVKLRRIRLEAGNLGFSSPGLHLLGLRAPPPRRPERQAPAPRAHVLRAIDGRLGNVILDRDLPCEAASRPKRHG